MDGDIGDLLFLSSYAGSLSVPLNPRAAAALPALLASP